MVSKNPNPPEGFFLDPSGMALPGLGPFASSAAASASSSEDLSKKVRKPYTITKSRESWTEPEHDKFLEALHLFDRDWKKIEAFVGSKTVVQPCTKVLFEGSNEHLPPPRPKRKASHPYPQKASKTASIQPGFMIRPDSSSILMSSVPSCNMSSWTPNSVQTLNLSHAPKASVGANNCCSSTESHPREQGNHSNPPRVLPDFSQVYTFIGSVFDSNCCGHLQKLKKMDPIDVKTVLLLMRNLSINLTHPDLEEHRRVLSSCQIDTGPTNRMDPVQWHELEI